MCISIVVRIFQARVDSASAAWALKRIFCWSFEGLCTLSSYKPSLSHHTHKHTHCVLIIFISKRGAHKKAKQMCRLLFFFL